MNKHFFEAFILYNWPAVLWLMLCAIKVWDYTIIPTFDDEAMPVKFALDRLRDMLYGVRWGYAGLFGVIYMFFTYHRVTQSAIENIVSENVNKAHEN